MGAAGFSAVHAGTVNPQDTEMLAKIANCVLAILTLVAIGQFAERWREVPLQIERTVIDNMVLVEEALVDE